MSDFLLPFVGRSEELTSLKTFYDRGWHRGAGFLLLYGRKGVGKTRLLEQFLQEEGVADYFYWQAPPGDAAIQLQEFSQALLRYDPALTGPPSPDFTFFSWRAALDYLAQIAQRTSVTKLFILEGFTELCHQSMGLSSYFQHAWDHRLKEIANLRLIITGSHVSTMIREVLAYSAPLYFRANANLHLKPLPYTVLLDLFPDRSVEERMAIYAITGGGPAYLNYFVQTPDLLTAVERLCFTPDSSFFADMKTIFDEPLEEQALCQAVLMALSEGPATPEMLSQRLEIPYDDLQTPLYFLRLLKLIEDSRSVHDPIASLRIRHTLAEPSLHFYYQNLKPALNMPSPRETAAAACASLNNCLGEAPFVALCRDWTWAAAITKQIDILPQKVGAYWDDQTQAPEFPIAAANSREMKLLVGVSLWDNGRLTPADLEELIQDMHRLPQGRIKGWRIRLVVFGQRPFTADVRAAATATGVRLVTLAEIEPLLLVAREARWREQDSPASEPFEF
ncbi:MAG: AAA family ATPase [Anaerolineales bacterium]|nr:AAA family ATPase [Anaerolineales bacterium]